MMRITDRLFDAGLIAFPKEFRARYADEMRDVFHARGSAVSLTAAICEALDLCFSGLRMRFDSKYVRTPVLMMITAAAMAATTLILTDASSHAASRIDFSAQDPSGPFTITIIDGEAVEATINRKRLDSNRIVAVGDSIHLLKDDGSIAVAVAFDPANNAIAWSPRGTATQ